MKLMIASDIHGSYKYASALVERFKCSDCEKLILLGDILYHGPRNDLPEEYLPKKVIELLNPLKDKILSVRGNCDTEVDQMVLEFPTLADYAVIYDGQRSLFATHGHKYGPDSLPPLSEGDILLYGHTHVMKSEQRKGVTCINPGSVSIPKENTPHSYAVYEDGVFTFYSLDDGMISEYRV